MAKKKKAPAPPVSEEQCELCGGRELMNFSCMLPKVGQLLTADVCLTCWAEASDDFHLAMRLLKKRADAAGVKLPVDRPEQLLPLLEKPKPEQGAKE